MCAQQARAGLDRGVRKSGHPLLPVRQGPDPSAAGALTGGNRSALTRPRQWGYWRRGTAMSLPAKAGTPAACGVTAALADRSCIKDDGLFGCVDAAMVCEECRLKIEMSPLIAITVSLGCLLSALGVSTLLTAAVRRWSLRWGFLDVPGGHKAHSAPIALGGGIAIVWSFVLVVAVGLAVMLLAGKQGPLGVLEVYRAGLIAKLPSLLMIVAGGPLPACRGADR